MGPRPPSTSSDKKSCQNVSPEKPSSTSFCHPQFPQHLLSHPAYAMNFPFPPFPHYPPYSQNFQYAVPPQYAPYSLPPPDGVMPSPYVPATMDKTWLMYNKEAHVMYLEEAKHKFTFGHCWNAVWDQPKWKEYISSFSTKRVMQSESGGYVSSSEDSEDMQGKCLVDPLYMLTKNREDMTEVQPSVSNQKMQLELLTADASWPIEFQLGRHQLMTGTSKLNEHQQGMAMRDEMLEKGSGPQDFELLDNERVAREDEPKKETQPHQGFKARKVSRKRKGKASSSSCEVQEDIKHALYLQTMLNNDREKMSEVQLHLSKEQLELTRIKQDEANVKKETTLYMKYTELLLADTSRFDEFQKAEYEKAVKHIGGILFSKDVN
uniref:No apical meristem-associated C-terminal domain-containing protein n=1 Tax=Oryza glumipatula TaxID=40148 RepID=A0A0E0B198_9ORYZ